MISAPNSILELSGQVIDKSNNKFDYKYIITTRGDIKHQVGCHPWVEQENKEKRQNRTKFVCLFPFNLEKQKQNRFSFVWWTFSLKGI